MSVKYIVDTNGKATGVLVPIQLWNRLTSHKSKRKLTKSDLAKYSGKLKLSMDPLKFQKAIR